MFIEKKIRVNIHAFGDFCEKYEKYKGRLEPIESCVYLSEGEGFFCDLFRARLHNGSFGVERCDGCIVSFGNAEFHEEDYVLARDIHYVKENKVVLCEE